MNKCIVEGCNNLGRSRGKRKRSNLCNKHHRAKYPRSEAYYQRRRDNARLRRCNLTRQEYEGMIDQQGNCCGICGKHLDKPYIDHCHKTGKVRGVLCNKCNWGLGMFDDDIDLLASATSYLLNSRIKLVKGA